jgi:hypothetical protein
MPKLTIQVFCSHCGRELNGDFECAKDEDGVTNIHINSDTCEGCTKATYNDGYQNGHEVGVSDGFDEGYDEGLTEGRRERTGGEED